MEFGLCIENGRLKVYGAGLLSSVAEMKHVIDGIRNNKLCISDFRCEDAIRTPCIVTSYQKRYFVTSTLEVAKQELRKFAKQLKKPGNIKYNPYTQTIEVDEEANNEKKTVMKAIGKARVNSENSEDEDDVDVSESEDSEDSDSDEQSDDKKNDEAMGNEQQVGRENRLFFRRSIVVSYIVLYMYMNCR